MKVFKDGKCYIQYSDLKRLVRYSWTYTPKIPYELLFTARIHFCNEDNIRDLVLIEDPESVMFIKNADFILDYDKCKKSGFKELRKGMKETYTKGKDIEKSVKDLDIDSNEYKTKINEFMVSRYKFYSYMDAIGMKKEAYKKRLIISKDE